MVGYGVVTGRLVGNLLGPGVIGRLDGVLLGRKVGCRVVGMGVGGDVGANEVGMRRANVPQLIGDFVVGGGDGLVTELESAGLVGSSTCDTENKISLSG